MELLYMDESGSMTSEFTKTNDFFVISIVRAIDKDILKKTFKNFIRKNKNNLKINSKADKMFKGGKFSELKGSALTREQKQRFIQTFSESKSFEVFYVILDNKRVDDCLYLNTARAFNYMIKLVLQHMLRKGLIKKNEEILIQIDERNERPEAKLHLQEYLNTSFQLESKLTKEISVRYFDSTNNELIQMADVLSNLYYSHLKTLAYGKEIELLKKKGILKLEFMFPPKN